MAFEFLRAENDASPIEKEIVASNGVTYNHGCLVAYGAAGTAVTTSTTPEFVYAGKTTTAVTGDKLAVIPILPEYEWETTFSANAASLKAGAKVTVTGEAATATTASGIFQILSDGGASGTAIAGRFS